MLSLSIASPSGITLSSFSNLSLSHKSSSFHGTRIAHVIPTRIPSVRALRAAYSPVMMAKREEELKEIRGLTTEQIQEEVVDLKGELFMLRLQKSARNEFKSSEFRRMRKRVIIVIL